jgi:aryl-alcohol dehydrogenase-like predicted oxidoreductase
MEYRYMGRTGLKVSALCMGCMTFARETDEQTSQQILDRFVEAGGNFIDTADVYSRGASEEIVGRWLKARRNRQQMIVATKVRFTMGSGPNDVGASRKHLMDGVEASLRRLQTDYIDLYQIHCWDNRTPLEETLRTLDDLVAAGKVRYLGASNFTAWQLMKALAISEIHGWSCFVCLQPQYSLLVRTIEWELLPLCRGEGLGVIPWSPLAEGWLTGKFRREERPPSNTRVGQEISSDEKWRQFLNSQEAERRWRILDAVGAIAKERGKTHAQIALAWVLSQPGVTAPILGARTLEQLEDNLGCLGWALSDEEMKRLNEASEPGLPYPYDFITRWGIRD